MKKKIIALLLVFVTLLTLVGCNKTEIPGKEDPGKNAQAEAVRPKYAYQPTYLPMVCEDAEMQYVGDFCVSGDHAYYHGECVVGEEPWLDEITGEPILDPNGEPVMNTITETALFAMDLTTGAVKKLEGFQKAQIPEDMEGNSYINGIFAGADGTFWICEQINTYFFDLPADFDPAVDNSYDYYREGDNINRLHNLDSQGKVLKTIELEQTENNYVYNPIMSPQGEFYATDWENILVYDAEGKLSKTLPMEDPVSNLVDLGGGRIVTIAWSEEGNMLYEIDTEAKALKEPQVIPNSLYTLYPGFDEYAYIYESSGAFFGHKDSDGTDERIFSWLDCDVDSSYFYGMTDILPDGRVFTLESTYDEKAQRSDYSLIMMEQVDPATLPVKQELILGCFYLEWDMRSEIVKFNRSNDQVRIVVHDYSQYATDGDYEAGLKKFNTELMSGMVPDLFLLNNSMPVDQYIAKGFLTDLWPLIDADPELSRDDLMTHFFDALSVDGKLYQIIDNFSIATVAAKESVVGTGESWTMDELMDTLENQPEGTTIFGKYDTKASILSNFVARNADSFVDWGTLQCSFNSPEFIDMLTFANRFPTEINYDDMMGDVDWAMEESEASLLRSGKQMLYRTGLYAFESLQWANRVFGEPVNFIGYPSASGNGSSFEVGGGLAISTSCANVDAAWSFVRTYLTEEHQTQAYMYQFPTNKHSFDEMVRQAMTPQYETDPITGEQVEIARNSIWYGNEEIVDIYAMTQEELDLFMEIYNNCNSFYSYHSEINELITAEAEPFFAGQKTAEETAKLIQDKVSLYVFENG